MVGAVLASVPTVILYVCFLDYYVSGLTAGALTERRAPSAPLRQSLKPGRGCVKPGGTRRFRSSGLVLHVFIQ